MIIVNYFREEDYNPDTDGYHLHLAGVINDVLSLNGDIDLITEAIDNDPDFEPKNGVLYEIYLDRATIAADPFPSLTREMPDEMVEGVDFELDYQFKRNDEGNDRWRSVTEYSYIRETFLDKRIIAVPISVKTEPTPSVEKKKKVLKSESIPEFDESLESMTEGQKARVDASMGLSMEDVLKRNGFDTDLLSINYLGNVLKKAMSEWASIKCAEKDREIDELKRDKLYWQLEASAKNKELATKETDIEHLKKINRLACNDIDTIHSQKEESVKELVELLDRIVGSMALERAERFDLNNSAKYLITKHKHHELPISHQAQSSNHAP